MAGLLERSLLVGLGVMTLTRDKIKQAVDRMVEEGEVKADEASDLVDKLVARGEEEREQLRKLLRDELEKYNVGVPVASRQDVEELNHKIDKLAAQVEKLAKTEKKKSK